MATRRSNDPVAAAVQLPPRQRYSLQRKLLLWTLVLMVTPMLFSSFWLSRVNRQLLEKQHADNAILVSQTMASALSGRLTLEAARAGELRSSVAPMLAALERDQRLAFVVVADTTMTPLYRYAVDGKAWAAASEHLEKAGSGTLNVDKPIYIPGEQDLVIIKVPIWSEPFVGRHITQSPKLQGFFILAMREDVMSKAVDHLRTAQITAIAAMCLLFLPVVIWAVRRWCAPLRALLEGTLRLSAGEAPTPVPVRSQDELGALAHSFNHMSRKLYFTRQQLERANEVLEQKVINRTAELERLNRKLESEIHDKNEFLRAISHDLGAPLRNINGITSVLLMKYRNQFTEDTLVKLERISANAKVQADLINDLLELSRIRSRPGKREQVDLNELMAQLRDQLAFDLEKARIELVVMPGLPVVIAERTRMRQIFQNLLDNAIKYMLDATTRRITVNCVTEGEWWHLTVADTGCGISAEDVPHVFDLFRRATHSNSHQVSGRGVGLSTVKTIVEHYGGRIWVESALGKGTTFHITFDRKAMTTRAQPTDVVTAALGEARPTDSETQAGDTPEIRKQENKSPILVRR